MSKKSRAHRLVGEDIDYEWCMGINIPCKVVKVVVVPKKGAWAVENNHKFDQPVLALELKPKNKDNPRSSSRAFRAKYSDGIYRRWKRQKNQSDAR